MRFLRLICAVTLTIISLVVRGQQSDYFIEDNSFHYLYDQRNIKECKLKSTDFKISFLRFRFIEKIQFFDKSGNLIREREYYDRDKSDGWEIYYHYDAKRQLISDEWLWIEDKLWEKSEYNYREDGQLESECELHKYGNDLEYGLDSCTQFIYKSNVLELVLNSDLDTIDYLINKSNVLKKYSKGRLTAEYKNKLKTRSLTKDKVYDFEYNDRGQIIKTTTIDYNNNFLGTVNFYYKHGLPFKTIYKDKDGRVTEREKYRYKKWKKNGS